MKTEDFDGRIFREIARNRGGQLFLQIFQVQFEFDEKFRQIDF